MTIRELAPGEFTRLKAVSDGIVPDPKSSVAVVAENEEGIVGRILALQPVHLEGTWVAEGKRSGLLAYRMFKFMESTLKDKYGVSYLLAFSRDPVVTGYLERLGYRDMHFSVLAREL